ncbi:MAG: NAD(P)/FAD-dependent oxidoreductase [Candidatus Thorarchaeota archaeon]|jgi:geranylgeranyl reductase family protein
MVQETKVVIVGAGPAGLSAANILSSQGIDYFLITKEDKPCVDKVCGGFIPARALEEFKIGSIKDAHEITSIRMKFPGMDVVRVDFDKPVGVNTTRGDLGQSMLDKLPKPQDTVKLSTKVDSIKETSEGIESTYTGPEGKESISAEILIDASGANSVSIRNGLVRERIPNTQMGYGIQYHLELPEEGRSFEPVNDFYYGSEYSPGGYAWLFPRSRLAVAGTGGIVSRIRTSDIRVEEYLKQVIQEAAAQSESLKIANVIKKETALMPLAGRVRPSYSNHILLVGDAAGHCSPISGEGIHYAMVGGAVAAQVATEALSRDTVSKKFLSKYEKRWMGEIGSDLKWGAWLQKRFTTGGSSSLGSSFLDSEKSQRVIAEMLVGERSVRSAITKAAPGYLKSKIGI